MKFLEIILSPEANKQIGEWIQVMFVVAILLFVMTMVVNATPIVVKVCKIVFTSPPPAKQIQALEQLRIFQNALIDFQIQSLSKETNQ
jgi:hypothetical protein